MHREAHRRGTQTTDPDELFPLRHEIGFCSNVAFSCRSLLIFCRDHHAGDRKTGLTAETPQQKEGEDENKNRHGLQITVSRTMLPSFLLLSQGLGPPCL